MQSRSDHVGLLPQRTDHVKYVLLDALSLMIATGPVVASATAML